MKAAILFCFSLFIFGTSYGQLTWSSGIPLNTDYDNSYSPMETVMYDNDVYQISDSIGSYIEITRYNSKTSQWEDITKIYNADYNFAFRTAILNDNLYIFVSGSSMITSYKYNFTTKVLSSCVGTLTATVSSSWIIKYAPGGSLFYLAYVDNDIDVHLGKFDTASEQFTDFNYTSFINPTGTDLSNSKLALYISNTDLYLGASGAVNRLGKASLSNLGAFQYYNNADTNDGYMKLNGSLLVNGFYYLTGDGQSAPYITVQDAASYTGYEEPLGNMNVDITTASSTANTFYTWANDYESMETAAYAFLVSPFSTAGDGSNYNKFYLYRKDNGSNVWDSLGPKIEMGIYDVTPNTLRLSLENTHQTHMDVNYASVDGEYFFKVLNNVPSIIPASETASSGMCGGHNNLIYPQLEFEDADNDLIRILSVTSSNGNVQNAYAVPIGTDNSTSPGISKFAIYGFVQTQGTTSITITYTDGWNIFTNTLNPINISGNALNITFAPELSHLCNNENMINLSDYVSYVDQGVFSINGTVVPNGLIDGTVYSVTQPTGSLTYDINVDGCIIQTGTGYNFVNAGSVTVTTLPATCGNTDGSAQVTYTPGSAPTYTVEWSTGEGGSTISNLAPGAYYFHVVDSYGCHVTGFAGIETSSIGVTETITPISCYGAQDGQLSVSVTGPVNYSVLWSNGYSTPTIDNLDAGTYWVTVRDLDNNCEVTYNYTITEPAEITAFFSSVEPTCGLSNGNIYGTYNGGTGTLIFDWLSSTQTTADLYSVPHGYYEVEVTDGAGCIDTFAYQLDNYQAIDIDETIFPTTCNLATGAIYLMLQQDPNGGAVVPDAISWSNGSIGPIIGSLATGTYTVEVISTDINPPYEQCYASKQIFVPIKAPIGQPICIVTVDTATTTNLVVWSRSELYGIDHYNIYRENAVAGEFTLIDTVDFNNLSVFNDVVASPMDKSWRYKMSQVNECGIESPVSIPHKTLHLNTIDIVPNQSVNILWDDYEGPIGSAEYVVWRHSDQNGWQALTPSVAVGTTNFVDANTINLTGLDYYIEMVLDAPCTAEKAQDFNTTRSNKDKGAFSAGSGTGNSNNGLSENNFAYTVYPNPVTDQLNIVITENGIGQQYRVYSAMGQELLSSVISGATVQIDLSSLADGIYYLEIEGSSEVIPVVKQH